MVEMPSLHDLLASAEGLSLLTPHPFASQGQFEGTARHSRSRIAHAANCNRP